jgi:dUTP pyrophosphatase
MKSIELKFLNKNLLDKELEIKYQTAGAAGVDLRYCGISDSDCFDPIIIKPNETKLLKSGIAINIKENSYVGLVFPRSGLGHKHGIVLSNLTGVIDSDYQGEIKISLWNRSNKEYTILPYDRLAQLVFVKIAQPEFVLVDDFEKTDRGECGFGSTGR